MSARGSPIEHCMPGHGCITCADEAIPMRVVRADVEDGIALCTDAAGRPHDVMIALVEAVAAGDLLLVHAGTALARLPDTTDGGA